LNKEWTVDWVGMVTAGVWFLVVGTLGFLVMWTATSNVFSDSFMKVVAILFGVAFGFGAIIFLWTGIRGWRKR